MFAGVSLLTRKAGNLATPVVELTKADDGKFSLSSNSTFKNTAFSFKLGEEFDEETPDGRKVKSVVVQEGNKLVHTQTEKKSSGDQVSVIVREFQPDQLTMVCILLKNIRKHFAP